MIDKKSLERAIKDATAHPEKMTGVCMTPQEAQEILDMLNRQESEVEMEGGGSSWWFVCGECHTSLYTPDKYCRQCGRKLIWT